MKFPDSLKRVVVGLALAAAIIVGQPAPHDAAAQSGQYQVKISNLPVPATGSTYVSAGDVVGANRNNVTYRLIANFGAGCLSHQWVSAISPQGYGTCTQPGYSDISGLGTAAAANLGTSGSTVPLLSSNLTWSGTDTFTGAMPSLSNGNAALGASTTGGGKFAGKGATYDITFQNGAAATVCTVATGTTTLNCTGLQVGGANVLTSGGTSGTFFGSSTTANPQISGTPTSGFYTGSGTISLEISGVQIANWAASGFSINAGTYQIGSAQVLSAYGTETTSLGLGALTSGTNMPYSTAIGALALHNGGSGVYNTAIGAEALYSTTTGQRNTAVGYSAVHSAASSTSDNTGIGTNALFNATGGSNTALGSGAGSHITTGTQNVIIGPNVASSTLTIGTNNIIIGTSSAADATTSSSANTMWIGGGSTAIMSVTSTNATPNVTVPGNLTISGTCTGCGSGALPATTTANQILISTTTSGLGAWTSAPSITNNMTAAGFIPTAFATAFKATATGDNASSGYVGEYLSIAVMNASAVSLTTNTGANITGLGLTAGDWDVWGQIEFKGGATTAVTYAAASINTASGTVTDVQPGFTNNAMNAATPFGSSFPTLSYAVPMQRVSLAATTSYYLNAISGFTISTEAAYGTINARRVR